MIAASDPARTVLLPSPPVGAVVEPDRHAEVTRLAFPPRLRIVRRIGAGGMAEVFAALRLESDGSHTPVVVKRPLPELAANPEFVTMFLDEARIAAALEHPNIVRVHEVVHDENDCLLVLELVEGKSLASLLTQIEGVGERVEARLASYVVARAAAGLHHAHELRDRSGRPVQIVHRDVSPQNLLISFDGEVKVIDFGIASALGRVTRTKTGTRKGKTGYMAPEQAKAGVLDRRVDIFALGILLWEMLCGRRLFLRPDDYRTMNALLVDPIPLPSSIVAVPPELEAIVMRALARDPNLRYQSAEQLRAALDAFIGSVGGAEPVDLAAIMRRHYPNHGSLLRPEEEPSVGPEIGPAVVTRPTIALHGHGRYGRRETALLVFGALAAASVGAVIGWAGKRLHAHAVPLVAAATAPAPLRGIVAEPIVVAPIEPPLTVPAPEAPATVAPIVEGPEAPPHARRPAHPGRPPRTARLSAKSNPF